MHNVVVQSVLSPPISTTPTESLNESLLIAARATRVIFCPEISSPDQTMMFHPDITSDCGAVSNVQNDHHYTDTPDKTVTAVLTAGMDTDCGGYANPKTFDWPPLIHSLCAQAPRHMLSFTHTRPTIVHTLSHAQPQLRLFYISFCVSSWFHRHISVRSFVHVYTNAVVVCISTHDQ